MLNLGKLSLQAINRVFSIRVDIKEVFPDINENSELI